VLVGAETVIRDDPELTCRRRGGHNPLRVILDGRLRLPLHARVLTKTGSAATLVLAGRRAPVGKVRRVRATGTEVLLLPETAGKLSLPRAMRALGQRGVMSVLIEGGAAVAAAALAAHVVDRLLIFYAPMLIGGDGRPMLGALGVRRLRQALRLGPLRITRFMDDLLIATKVIER